MSLLKLKCAERERVLTLCRQTFVGVPSSCHYANCLRCLVCFDCIQRTFLSFPELMGGRFSYCCVLRSVSYCAAHVAEVSPDVVKLKGYGGRVFWSRHALEARVMKGSALCWSGRNRWHLKAIWGRGFPGPIALAILQIAGVSCITFLRNVAAYVACFLGRHVFG